MGRRLPRLVAPALALVAAAGSGVAYASAARGATGPQGIPGPARRAVPAVLRVVPLRGSPGSSVTAGNLRVHDGVVGGGSDPARAAPSTPWGPAMDNPFVGLGIVVGLLALAALALVPFGPRGLSVLDRWRGVRHPWAKDHHGID